MLRSLEMKKVRTALVSLASIVLCVSFARGASAEEPATRKGWSARDEAAIGGVMLGAGYALAMPVVFMPDMPKENRVAAVPVVGPMWWWTVAYQRVQERAAYEKAHPCKGPDTGGGCWDTGSAVADLHLTFGLPYALSMTALQAGGAAVMLHALFRSDDAKPVTRAASAETHVIVSPTPSGVAVAGTF